MRDNEHASRSLVGAGGWLLSHTAALVVGLALIVTGIGLGVTIVLLPIGVPVGLVGVFLMIWGLVGTSRARSSAGGPPT